MWKHGSYMLRKKNKCLTRCRLSCPRDPYVFGLGFVLLTDIHLCHWWLETVTVPTQQAADLSYRLVTILELTATLEGTMDTVEESRREGGK